MIVDGYTDGLGAAMWLLGAVLGLVTALGPWAAGGWLLQRSARTLWRSRPAWWIRARRAVRRQRRTRGWGG